MGASLLTLMVLSVALGLCLARFTVLAVLVAAAALIIGTFVHDMVRHLPITHSLLASIIVVLFLPASYLVVQLVRPSRK